MSYAGFLSTQATRLIYQTGSTWGTEESWITGGQFACRIRPLSGGKTFTDSKNLYSATHRIYALPSCGVRPGDRVTSMGRLYFVKYVTNPMEMGQQYYIDCDIIEQNIGLIPSETIYPSRLLFPSSAI